MCREQLLLEYSQLYMPIIYLFFLSLSLLFLFSPLPNTFTKVEWISIEKEDRSFTEVGIYTSSTFKKSGDFSSSGKIKPVKIRKGGGRE